MSDELDKKRDELHWKVVQEAIKMKFTEEDFKTLGEDEYKKLCEDNSRMGVWMWNKAWDACREEMEKGYNSLTRYKTMCDSLNELTTEKAKAEMYRKLLVELLDTSDNISDDEYFKIKETLYGKDVEQALKEYRGENG